MMNVFKICSYCRESCVLLLLSCDTILKMAFSFKKMGVFTIFNRVHDLVKRKVDLTSELLLNQTLPNLDIYWFLSLQLQYKVKGGFLT